MFGPEIVFRGTQKDYDIINGSLPLPQPPYGKGQ
jgi:hypothetical protein